MPGQIVGPAIAVACLVLVHFFAGRILGLGGEARNWILSLAGGVAVAYVFVHLLPELQEGQEVLEDVQHPVGAWTDHHVYLLALAGLVAFLGLDRAAKALAPAQDLPDEQKHRLASWIFWTHTSSFVAYNALIGYVLLRRFGPQTLELLLFTFAMAMHFLVNDVGLRQHYREQYERFGRWALSGAIVCGVLIGLLIELPEELFSALLAFLAGGIILNVLKEELPEFRGSHFWGFALGALAFGAVLGLTVGV